MGKIIELSPEIYNRIAAGEVIENSSSVVKELLENALDANSTSIEIIIKNAGKKEITVADNGTGMNQSDLFLAIKKHTTSKIKSIDDLNRIRSFGFRGEALSSIVSVAVVEITSKDGKSAQGIKMMIEDAGKNIKESRVSFNTGTSVSVFNLFYNTPARFKFLKSDKYELLKIKQTVDMLLIPHYDLDFKLIYEGKRPLLYKQRKNL
ncbi:MAG: DNA mismatch repair endonuclease MutL, partial [Spirochaetes bacterium]|nr:DNA mismatch repair endonuclease MutL [Spirochaetota bacterium]